MKEITKSGFQFANPRVKKVIFEINEDFSEAKYEGMPISYGVRITEREESSALVELELNIGLEGETTPFYVELTIVSKFRWTDDVEAPADSLLKLNATTLLISYARPIIAHLTADSGIKPFNLPFIDVRNDFDEEETE